jgi:hypothetical protein
VTTGRAARRTPVQSRTYEITFVGQAGAALRAEFDDCDVSVGQGTTTLRAEIPDQGALQGLLQRITSLGLELVDVTLRPPERLLTSDTYGQHPRRAGAQRTYRGPKPRRKAAASPRRAACGPETKGIRPGGPCVATEGGHTVDRTGQRFPSRRRPQRIRRRARRCMPAAETGDKGRPKGSMNSAHGPVEVGTAPSRSLML